MVEGHLKKLSADLDHFEPLGNFLSNTKEYIEAGFIGGVLSVGWPFFSRDWKKLEFKLSGRIREEHREYLAIETRQLIGTPIVFYFDPATFHHLITKYQGRIRTRSPLQPKMVGDDPEKNSGEVVTFTEHFSDFQTFGELYLPACWQIWIDLPEDRLKWEIKFDHIFSTEAEY
jgi:hypothetical protein